MQLPVRTQAGFTVIEMLISLAIAALLLTAMSGLVNNVLEARDDTRTRGDALQDARFAMQRMVTATRDTDRLLLPLADNPNTNWHENVREQTVPASPPEGDSTLATAVLAVALAPDLDIDGDGVDDADNDKDGRVDEDPSDDASNDLAPGIVGIDDDGDGAVDESSIIPDDDEDGGDDEDPVNGVDDDGDGALDEDAAHDNNNDGESGVAGFDDDGDGSIDEDHQHDDDEDGTRDEDWIDVHAFYLRGADLIERRPNLNPADGTDFSEHVIAENVSRFRVERIPDDGRRAVLIDITLDIARAAGETVSLNTRIRAGGAR